MQNYINKFNNINSEVFCMKQYHVTFKTEFKEQCQALLPEGIKFKDWVKSLVERGYYHLQEDKNANN